MEDTKYYFKSLLYKVKEKTNTWYFESKDGDSISCQNIIPKTLLEVWKDRIPKYVTKSELITIGAINV